MTEQSSTNSPRRSLTGWQWWLLGLGLVGTAIFMAAASRGNLSLDEVLSLETALGAKSWPSIVLEHNDDNNHLLNTFFLRLIGWQTDLFVYRIPVVIFGILTVAALAFTARRWSIAASVWVVFLAGWSYPFVLYCSEARGYAAALFFSVVSYELLQRCRDRDSWPHVCLFWLSLCLGFLSHFSFVMVQIALGTWTLIDEKMKGTPLLRLVVNTARLYAVPAFFVAIVYVVFIWHISVLGGTIFTGWQMTVDVTAYALGLGGTGNYQWMAIPACAILAGSGIWCLYRQKRAEWLFFLLVLTFAPVTAAALAHLQFFGFRYFLVCFPFFYLLLACLFAEWSRNPRVKLLPVCLILVITAGHIVKNISLVQWGRGSYQQAVEDMAAATPGQDIHVGGDSDFKDGKMLRFYGLLLPEKKVHYVLHDNIVDERPDWLVVCYFQGYSSLMVKNQLKYELFSVYPYCGMSGMTWSVYRLANESRAKTNSVSAVR